MSKSSDEDRAADELSPQERSSPSGSASLLQKEDPEYEMVDVDYITYALDDKRSVSVGQSPGRSRVFLRFYNEGEVTLKSQISIEAAKALGRLLDCVSERGLLAVSQVVVDCERDTRPKDRDPLGAPLASSPVCEANSPNFSRSGD